MLHFISCMYKKKISNQWWLMAFSYLSGIPVVLLILLFS